MIKMIMFTGIYLCAIVLLLLIHEYIYRKLNVKGEYTRKSAHLIATLATVPFPFVFNNHWYPFTLAIFFFVLLFISKAGTKLNSIHDIERISMGSFLLPVSIYLCFLISEICHSDILFIMPISILAISDPLAAIIGMKIKNWNPKIRIYKFGIVKSLWGSLSFWVSALVLSLVSFMIFPLEIKGFYFLFALLIATISMIIEIISPWGTDNLTVPLSISAILLLIIS